MARAIRALRETTNPEPGDRVVPLSPQMIGLRFTAVARNAGVDRRVTAHSGRVGLASELTSRGASTTDVMLAGNWKTSRMVAHYSAGATAERGAVARYFVGARRSKTDGFPVARPDRPPPNGSVCAVFSLLYADAVINDGDPRDEEMTRARCRCRP